MISPKDRFLRDSAKTKAVGELLEQMEEALHVAFNEYCWRLARTTKNNPVEAANSQFRQAGAEEFIELLSTLHRPTIPPSTVDHSALIPPS